ncbi:MAG: hypothetical protein IKW66_00105, partial [Clostridia bacterium]|nr:hypothetical protein [Clostridia bacterium]
MKITPSVRFLICLMTVFMLLALGPVGCTPQPEPPADDTNNPADPPSDEQKEVLALISQGISNYTTIRPDTASVEIRQAVMNLTQAFIDTTGYTIKPGTDWVNYGEEVPTDTLEILVGRTNRAESIAAHAALKETEYTIAVMGKRLVIVGYDDACTTAAVTAFIDMLSGFVKTTDGALDLAIPSDFLHNGTFVVKSYLDEFDKSSYAYYLDDKLTMTEEQLLYFDMFDDFEYPGSAEAEGYVDDAIGFTCTKDTPHWSLLNTPVDSFSIEVYDKFAQTV